jgi:chromosome segregation ATPase
MKKPAQKAFILVVGIVIMLVAGCEEQMAGEKIQLKEQLEQRDREIENRKALLEKCLREKRASEQQAHKDLEELAGSSLQDFEDILKLREENEELKTRVEQLEEEVEALKKEPSLKPL